MPAVVSLAPRARALALLVALASLSLAAPAASGRSEEDVRALWVTRYSLSSPAAVADLVRTAREGGFNTLLVQVRGRGDAYYTSTREPRASDLAARPDFDPLAATLQHAREAGIRVHAWVVLNLVSSAYELPASRQHLVYRQPDWLMVPRELAAEMQAVDPRSPEYVGRLARWTRAHSSEVEGLYVSPIHPGAATHVAAVVRELVEQYDLDGVHLDYARYPNADFDYSPGALQQFKAAVQGELTPEERRAAEARERLDPLAYPNLFPDRWDAFRRSRLTALVMRLRTVVKSARPDAAFSSAVVPDLVTAEDVKLQDWRTWLDQAILDVICPMAYTPDEQVFERQILAARDLAGADRVWAGVGAYRLTPAQTLRHVATARRLTGGVVLFSYDALVTPPNSGQSLAALGRSAFGETATK